MACIGEKAEAYGVFVGKYEHTRRLGKPRNRRKYNIKIMVNKYDWRM